MSCTSQYLPITTGHGMRPFSVPSLHRQALVTLLLVLLHCTCARAQAFTAYVTGNTQDLVTTPTGGVCMMGGRTENDEAMRWFLRRADGGDVVVLRASGSDGYNDYFHEELGVPVNSVRSFVFHAGGAAGAVEIQEAVRGAEAIWFAGGDQAKHLKYWRGKTRIIDAKDHITRVIRIETATSLKISATTMSPGSYYLVLAGEDKYARKRFVVS